MGKSYRRYHIKIESCRTTWSESSNQNEGFLSDEIDLVLLENNHVNIDKRVNCVTLSSLIQLDLDGIILGFSNCKIIRLVLSDFNTTFEAMLNDKYFDFLQSADGLNIRDKVHPIFKNVEAKYDLCVGKQRDLGDKLSTMHENIQFLTKQLSHVADLNMIIKQNVSDAIQMHQNMTRIKMKIF